MQLNSSLDEILVNAADNYQRDTSMNMIKIDIDKELGQISVWNNGRGVPIEIHKEHNVYVPELIFGKYLSL
jgi:DNA topoisomerase II